MRWGCIIGVDEVSLDDDLGSGKINKKRKVSQ